MGVGITMIAVNTLTMYTIAARCEPRSQTDLLHALTKATQDGQRQNAPSESPQKYNRYCNTEDSSAAALDFGNSCVRKEKVVALRLLCFVVRYGE